MVAYFNQAKFDNLTKIKRFLVEFGKIGSYINIDKGFINVENFINQAELETSYRRVLAFEKRYLKTVVDPNKYPFNQRRTLQMLDTIISESEADSDILDIESYLETDVDKAEYWLVNEDHYWEVVDSVLNSEKKTAFVLLGMIAKIFKRRRLVKDPVKLQRELYRSFINSKFDSWDKMIYNKLRTLLKPKNDTTTEELNSLLFKLLILTFNLRVDTVENVYIALDDSI